MELKPSQVYYLEHSTADKRGRNDGRSKDPEKRREYNAKFRRDNPEKIMLWSAKERAKKKGFEFNIDESDIKIPVYCPVLDIKLERGGNTANSPTLDRVDSSKGYVKGNVRVISKRANTIKNDATIEELKLVIAYMRGHEATV